jgi:uncharacterized membrane protein YhaH (DUF805 family)
MKTKCAFCFSRLDPEVSVCRICRIDSLKERSALTTAEQKIANRCRTLYTIGFLMIVGGVMGLLLFFPALSFLARRHSGENSASGGAFFMFYAVSMFSLILAMPIFGLALRRYKKWCYAGGIALYSLLILVNIPWMYLISIIFLFFLYCIASAPSKQIFYRGE